MNMQDFFDFPVFVFFDSEVDLRAFHATQSRASALPNVELRSVGSALKKLQPSSVFPRSLPALRDGTNDVASWGAGGHRSWVARKRSLALAYLFFEGYTSTWTADAESLALAPFSGAKLMDENTNPQRTLLAPNEKNSSAVFPPSPLRAPFRSSFGIRKGFHLGKVAIRQNDFWLIDLEQFNTSLNLYAKHYGCTAEGWLNGSEQSLFETYLYGMALSGTPTAKIISLKERLGGFFPMLKNWDLHGNNLFINVIRNHEVDIEEFSYMMNREYFAATPAFRGDYFAQLSTLGPRGAALQNLLDVRIAVSNYQGF